MVVLMGRFARLSLMAQLRWWSNRRTGKSLWVELLLAWRVRPVPAWAGSTRTGVLTQVLIRVARMLQPWPFRPMAKFWLVVYSQHWRARFAPISDGLTWMEPLIRVSSAVARERSIPWERSRMEKFWPEAHWD